MERKQTLHVCFACRYELKNAIASCFEKKNIVNFNEVEKLFHPLLTL